MCSDSSILLLHVGLDLSVLSSLLLLTWWWTAQVLSTRRAKREKWDQLTDTLNVMLLLNFKKQLLNFVFISKVSGVSISFYCHCPFSECLYKCLNCIKLTVTGHHHLLFIKEVKSLRLLSGELGEGAAPLHHAACGVVLLGRWLHLLYSRGTGGGAKQSAEAAGGEDSQKGHRADRSAGKKAG